MLAGSHLTTAHPPYPPHPHTRCQNMEGAYINSLQYVQLSGPTCFEPLLRQATAQAQASSARLPSVIAYTVLLLLTE